MSRSRSFVVNAVFSLYRSLQLAAMGAAPPVLMCLGLSCHPRPRTACVKAPMITGSFSLSGRRRRTLQGRGCPRHLCAVWGLTHSSEHLEHFGRVGKRVIVVSRLTAPSSQHVNETQEHRCVTPTLLYFSFPHKISKESHATAGLRVFVSQEYCSFSLGNN